MKSNTPIADATFFNDVVWGLSRSQKTLPSKYFYDKRGSDLFDQICELEEYYPTRTEIEIMRRYAKDMVASLGGGTLIEYGSGSSVKTEYLLRHLAPDTHYIPVDISAEHLAEAGEIVQRRHTEIVVRPLVADFTDMHSLPNELTDAPAPFHVYFPGSTLGNFDSCDASALLVNIAQLIGCDGKLLLSVDLVKDTAVLKAAYNDRSGITAQFNKNVLHRINSELGGDFNVDAFQHIAIWNDLEKRIEMYLRSRCEQTVVLGEQDFVFEEGESIRTEYSHKYHIPSLERIAATAGLHVADSWTDDQEWFAVMLLERI